MARGNTTKTLRTSSVSCTKYNSNQLWNTYGGGVYNTDTVFIPHWVKKKKVIFP